MTNRIPFATADLVDIYGQSVKSCTIQFRNMGGESYFFGPVTTIRCRNDNALLKATLGASSRQGVLVVDGGGNMDTALVGDLIARMAIDNGWAGIVINGPVRDSRVISTLPIGLKALGTNPAKSSKTGTGEKNITLSFGGIEISAGDWLYSDEDGILVSGHPLAFE